MSPTSPDAILHSCLVPLIPLRTTGCSVIHDGHALPDPAFMRCSPWRNQDRADQDWQSMLDLAAVALRKEAPSDAVAWLQQAQAWKNRQESDAQTSIQVTTRQWVTLAASSLAVGETDAAAAFALRAWDASSRDWIDDLRADCSSVSADATALLAIVRVSQHRADRAAQLIDRAIEGHREVGDMEQLAADHMLLSLCADALRQPDLAAESRGSADQIVKTALDESRHLRVRPLRCWLQRFGQPRPDLLKSSRLV